MVTFPLQIESVFLDYGVIGAVVVGLGMIAWKQYNKDQTQSDEYRKHYMDNTKEFIELSHRQTSIQEKQVEMQERQNKHFEEFYKAIDKKLDEVPVKVSDRMKLDKLNEAQPSQPGTNGLAS